MSASSRRRQLTLVAVTLLAVGAPPAAASGSALDKSFGKGGVARLALPFREGVRPALAPVRQPDGRLLVSAEIESLDVHGSPEAVIARFDRRGRVDRSFGNNGSRRFGFGGFAISSIVPLPDGRILVAGTANAGENLFSCSGGQFALIRLRRDGSLDRSFGHGGSLTWRPARLPNGATYPTGAVAQPSASGPVLVAGPDGRVVAAGSVCDRIQSDRLWENGFSTGFVWARFDVDGHIDAPAGSDGAHRLADAQVSGANWPWTQWLPQPGGRALAVRTAYDAPVGGRYTVKMRSFSLLDFTDSEPVGGWIDVTSAMGGLQFDSLVPARDGGLFLVGSEYGDAGLVRLQRVLASGSLDAEYGKVCPEPPAGHISGAAETSTGGLVATTAAFAIPRRRVVSVLYFSPSGCLERRLKIGPADLQLGRPLLQRGFRPVIGATSPHGLAVVRLVRGAPRP